MNIPYGQKRYLFESVFFKCAYTNYKNVFPYVSIRMYVSIYARIYSFSPVTIRDGAEEIKTNRCLYLVVRV